METWGKTFRVPASGTIGMPKSGNYKQLLVERFAIDRDVVDADALKRYHRSGLKSGVRVSVGGEELFLAPSEADELAVALTGRVGDGR